MNLIIYLLDCNIEIIRSWQKYFDTESNVNIVHQYFDDFMSENEVECIVSPANSFGLMDGGYDAAITAWFGEDLQKAVQKHIIENYYGEQPVGSSIIVDIPNDSMKLIHTPTMRVPERIYDPAIVYQCMRTCLVTALKNKIKSMVIPAFGGLCGGIDSDILAKMMWLAYKQIKNPPEEISWEYALNTHYRGID